ncbi:CAP domain-containing protein [Amycolatopsis sp. NPDC059657]|uniref:CAP domain-containing protein n=1 Tax=Amycolatopsis sp. NPDC059657 TaxID=3346899 RepID=UPI00367330F2
MSKRLLLLTVSFLVGGSVASGGALAAGQSTNASSLGDQVVSLVNKERAKVGCKPLGNDSRLALAAQRHSDDMSKRNYFSHTSLDGSDFGQRAVRAGYPNPAAENIAMGYTSAAQVMQGWMASDGHRHNILECSLKNVGVGVATQGWYWTQDFGR